MYSPTFRSLIRTMLRAERAKYDIKDGIPVPEITKSVVEKLKKQPLRRADRWEALYALVYDEARSLFTNVPHYEPLQLEFLLNSGVPRQHAALLVRINKHGLTVPGEDGSNKVKPLFGKERMTREELKRGADYERKKGNETIARADLLDELFQTPGYYK